MQQERDDVSAAARGLTSGALALALGIAAARCMMPDVLRDPFEVVPDVDLGARSAGAASMVFLNLLCFIPPLLVLLASLIDSNFRLVRAWSHFVFAGLGLWGLASTCWSSDRFAAVVTSGNLLAASLLGWTAAQSVRRWLRLRIVAGIAVGLLLVLVVHSILYKTVDVPSMREMWTAQRETLLRQRNFEPGSFQAQLFERKILGGEVMGFSNSPNTVAAVAVLALAVLLGSMLDRRRLADSAGWLAPGAILIGGAGWLIFVTGSRTAFATPLFAAGLLGAAPLLWKYSTAKPRRTFWLAVLLVVLGAALVVSHGLYRGNLVERSLTFRWHYWTAAWRMWISHLWCGVGWGNFGYWYPALKLPFAPEDVKDPHNLVVRFFSELGVVGLLLCLLWLLRSAWELTRPLPRERQPQPLNVVSEPVSAIAPFVLPCVLATVLVIALGVDFGQIPEFYLVETLRRLMYGCLLLGGAVLVGLKGVERPAADDRPANWLLTACGVALAAFLLHNMIDFSFFEAGPMSLSLMLLGACTGLRVEKRSLPAELARPAQRLLIIPLLLLAGAYTVAIAIPVIRAELLAGDADVLLAHSDRYAAAGQYQEAYDAIPHLRNGDYLVRAARARSLAGRPPQESLALLEQATLDNPRSGSAWNSKAQLLEFLRRGSESVAARLRAVELDPANVALRIAMGDLLAANGRAGEALEQYRMALHYNDLLPQDEIRRLPPEREQALRNKIGQSR